MQVMVLVYGLWLPSNLSGVHVGRRNASKHIKAKLLNIVGIRQAYLIAPSCSLSARCCSLSGGCWVLTS
jgi:hypothetical protein